MKTLLFDLTRYQKTPTICDLHARVRASSRTHNSPPVCLTQKLHLVFVLVLLYESGISSRPPKIALFFMCWCWCWYALCTRTRVCVFSKLFVILVCIEPSGLIQVSICRYTFIFFNLTKLGGCQRAVIRSTTNSHTSTRACACILTHAIKASNIVCVQMGIVNVRLSTVGCGLWEHYGVVIQVVWSHLTRASLHSCWGFYPIITSTV